MESNSMIDTNIYYISPPLAPTPNITTCENNSKKKLSIINPSELKKPFVSGEFIYIQDEHEREMMKTGWQSISQLELWSHIRNSSDNFMNSNDPKIKQIYNKIEELGYFGHSESSFVLTLRNLYFIAVRGENNFMKKYVSYNED